MGTRAAVWGGAHRTPLCLVHSSGRSLVDAQLAHHPQTLWWRRLVLEEAAAQVPPKWRVWLGVEACAVEVVEQEEEGGGRLLKITLWASSTRTTVPSRSSAGSRSPCAECCGVRCCPRVPAGWRGRDRLKCAKLPQPSTLWEHTDHCFPSVVPCPSVTSFFGPTGPLARTAANGAAAALCGESRHRGHFARGARTLRCRSLWCHVEEAERSSTT